MSENEKSPDNQSKFVERRKSPRFLFEHFGTIQVVGQSPQECYIMNLSQGGCMAYFNESVQANDEITISFAAGDRTFSREAIVRSTRNFTQLRRFILQIGKKLDFTSVLNIGFKEDIDTTDFGYIKLNYQE